MKIHILATALGVRKKLEVRAAVDADADAGRGGPVMGAATGVERAFAVDGWEIEMLKELPGDAVELPYLLPTAHAASSAALDAGMSAR